MERYCYRLDAPIGYVAIAKNSIATNQGFRSLVVNENCIPEYIYYWLAANTHELELNGFWNYLSGTLWIVIEARSRISLPDKETQRRIAHVLGTLDDKIELNRRMNDVRWRKWRGRSSSRGSSNLTLSTPKPRSNITSPRRLTRVPTCQSATRRNRNSDVSPVWTIERARAYLDKMDPVHRGAVPRSLRRFGIGRDTGWVGGEGDR